ncbi:acetyl/propionyl-CoA carboxylase subunit alpha (plasmid) [Aureimonas sp. SA4125]|uniref:acetyl/propionyl/methylcrotonyl-CoA carboxylase subunit alpha n=1 Tax=Aureimonas sp. SA4125 TaxID=2826993 RepID=UPI001CC63E28|nr:biotin carboxylase N-terminal domain-containing protein [Aureimonas sp. SA4125]BDA87175.1 acetyl/propionyl-CoA carboxylase subunit alpha [Aureimonas sp. SA4125]
MKKILIANRGEIALRIVRACRDAGYASVAIVSDVDRNAPHARFADEVYHLEGTSPRETYLNQAAILDVAARSSADAIHPGYGFLAENEIFAAAVMDAGLVWIGPDAAVIARLGDKVAARAVAREAGVPVLPSIDEKALTIETARSFISEHGLPVIVKAQNGGGGRGMRIVREAYELESQIAAAEREAGLAFGRAQCFLERYVENARHVETQCLADRHGRVVVLSTRDCSLQRRQQKLVEEAPAPFLTDAQNATLVKASVDILSIVGYCGAATCEYLVTPEGKVYFLEVNTRVQVEHPVTEEVTGIDIICEMFRIAEGEHVSEHVPALRGHAMEFRINAEDPWAEFRPTPGPIMKLNLPSGPGVRSDFGYVSGDTIPPYYDSLVGKLIVTGSDRNETIQRARRAFREFEIEGVTTIAPLHRAILDRDEFAAYDAADFKVSTKWIDIELPALAEAARAFISVATPTGSGASDDDIVSPYDTSAVQGEAEPLSYRRGIKAPLSGMILEICVSEGDAISYGDVLAVMESMKMEQQVIAETSGTVTRINVQEGSYIDMDADIMGVD